MQQKEIVLPSYKRGIHLITNSVLQEIPDIVDITMGMVHIFIKHSSASLTINENADPTVRIDFENHLNVLVPENASYYTHTYEVIYPILTTPSISYYGKKDI